MRCLQQSMLGRKMKIDGGLSSKPDGRFEFDLDQHCAQEEQIEIVRSVLHIMEQHHEEMEA